WQRPALSRQAWSPREEAPRMKEPKVPPGGPPCSQASTKLRSPVSAFFGKIAEGHAAGSATGILLGTPCLRLWPEDHDRITRGLKVVALDSRPWAAQRFADRSSPANSPATPQELDRRR